MTTFQLFGQFSKKTKKSILNGEFPPLESAPIFFTWAYHHGLSERIVLDSSTFIRDSWWGFSSMICLRGIEKVISLLNISYQFTEKLSVYWTLPFKGLITNISLVWYKVIDIYLFYLGVSFPNVYFGILQGLLGEKLKSIMS